MYLKKKKNLVLLIGGTFGTRKLMGSSRESTGLGVTPGQSALVFTSCDLGKQDDISEPPRS